MAAVNLAASYVGVKLLTADDIEGLEAAADAWLDGHIADEVIAIEAGPGGERPSLLIVYRRERRVRRS
jgi:hypothetical protein